MPLRFAVINVPRYSSITIRSQQEEYEAARDEVRLLVGRLKGSTKSRPKKSTAPEIELAKKQAELKIAEARAEVNGGFRGGDVRLNERKKGSCQSGGLAKGRVGMIRKTWLRSRSSAEVQDAELQNQAVTGRGIDVIKPSPGIDPWPLDRRDPREQTVNARPVPR